MVWPHTVLVEVVTGQSQDKVLNGGLVGLTLTRRQSHLVPGL